MECRKCGKCCRQTLIHLTKDLSESEMRVLIYKGGRIFGNRVIFNTPCIHLDSDGLCLIYEDRPQYCKDYHCEEASCLI